MPDHLDQVAEAGGGEVGEYAALEDGPDPFDGLSVTRQAIGGAAVFLGSLLLWISVYVFDPNRFKAVEVGNSISGGVRRHQPSSA